MLGEAEAAQEASLKHVRALQSTAFKSDPEKFAAMAAASLQLCSSYAGSGSGGPRSARDLAAARMHLRGILKQCQDNFEEEKLYKDMAVMLERVSQLEKEFSSAAA